MSYEQSKQEAIERTNLTINLECGRNMTLLEEAIFGIGFSEGNSFGSKNTLKIALETLRK